MQDRVADLVWDLSLRGGREHDDLQHLLLGGAEPQRIRDVAAQPALVEMRHRAIDRDVDELAHLWLEVAFARRAILEFR